MSFKSCQLVVVVTCFTVQLLMVSGMPSSAVIRRKRSDDGGPLEAVVEHLSQQLSSLDAQQTSVNSEITALKTQTAVLGTTVAFHAWNNANPVQTAALGTIVLNHAVTNVGNAYDPLTGVFTAPVSGLYDFQATVMSAHAGSGQRVYAAMNVDNTRVAIALSDTNHGHWNQATMKSIVHVSAGQKVYLKNADNSVAEYHSSHSEPYTTFSGILITAD